MRDSSYEFAFSRANMKRCLAVAACLPRLRPPIALLNASYTKLRSRVSI